MIANLPSSSTSPPQSTLGAASAAPTREVFGFATSGSLGDPTIGYPSWNFNLLSTVAFFSLHSYYNGNLVADSDWSMFTSSTFSNMVALAHQHGVKVVVTISPMFGYSDFVDFCDTLYNDASTVLQLVNQVVAKGLDGVNIDYEGEMQTCVPTDPSLTPMTDQALVTRLAKDMRAGLDAKKAGYYLSIDTYSGSASGNDGFFNIPDLNQYVDSFFVMAYDMDYANATLPPLGCSQFCLGPISPIGSYYWNDSISMSQYSTLVGSNKVILGQPYYGRVACVSSPTPHAIPKSNLTAATYTGAAAVVSSPDVKPGTFVAHRDTTDAVGLDRWDSWYDLSLNCWREMYWQDTTTMATRYNLVNRDNLRGVGIWTLNYGGGSPELWDLLSAYFQVWSAAYDLSVAPPTWVAGQTQTFAVTLTNSGTYTWPSGGTNPAMLDLHFATQTGAQPAAWLTSQLYALPSDVAPGASITFNVTATAPMQTGTMYLEAKMFKNQQFWFSQWQAVQVSVVPQAWTAGFDMSQVPINWQSGQTKSFPIILTNTGNVTWPSGTANPVMLDLHFTSSPGGSGHISSWMTSQIYRLPADVAPGQSTTLTVSATAPASTGYAYLEAELFKNQQFWFQQWSPLAVTLYGAWGASFDLSSAPSSWANGQTATFQIVVTNQGTQTWPSHGTGAVDLDLHFTTATGGNGHVAAWLTSQIFRLAADVAPGASATLSVTVTAPYRTGPMYLEAQMFKDHQFWFQQWTSVSVNVLQSWVAGYDTCQVPTEWAPGQSKTVSITLINQGASTWPSTGPNPVDLDLHFAPQPNAPVSSWLTSQIYTLPADLAPAGSVTVTVNVTAPQVSGNLYLEAAMFKSQQFWFAQAQAIPAAVGTPAWASDYNVCATPRTWTKGQSQTFQITLTNAGTQAWPSTGSNPVYLDIHFTTAAGGSAQIPSWVNSYIIALPNDVAPGASVTITVTVSAPGSAGSYYVEAQVFKDHQFWIQQWSPVAVTVS